MIVYTLKVNYRPPVKGGTHPDNPRRKEILHQAALDQLRLSTPLKNLVVIHVEHHNATGGDDAMNVLGGITDALEGAAYEDDEQIIEAHYKMYSDLGKSDWYTIKLQFLESTPHRFSEEEINRNRNGE